MSCNPYLIDFKSDKIVLRDMRKVLEFIYDKLEDETVSTKERIMLNKVLAEIISSPYKEVE